MHAGEEKGEDVELPPCPWSVAEVTNAASTVTDTDLATCILSHNASVRVFRDRFNIPNDLPTLLKRQRSRLNEFYCEIERSYSPFLSDEDFVHRRDECLKAVQQNCNPDTSHQLGMTCIAQIEETLQRLCSRNAIRGERGMGGYAKSLLGKGRITEALHDRLSDASRFRNINIGHEGVGAGCGVAIQPAKTHEFLRLYLDLLHEGVREADRAGAEGADSGGGKVGVRVASTCTGSEDGGGGAGGNGNHILMETDVGVILCENPENLQLHDTPMFFLDLTDPDVTVAVARTELAEQGIDEELGINGKKFVVITNTGRALALKQEAKKKVKDIITPLFNGKKVLLVHVPQAAVGGIADSNNGDCGEMMREGKGDDGDARIVASLVNSPTGDIFRESVRVQADREGKSKGLTEIMWRELKVENVLGKGKFGEVRRVWYHGAHCVVKLSHKMGKDEIDELMKEASAASAAAGHPNVCLFYGVTWFNPNIDTGYETRQLGLVSEYVGRREQRERRERGGCVLQL
jgi:hypothetical protein